MQGRCGKGDVTRYDNLRYLDQGYFDSALIGILDDEVVITLFHYGLLFVQVECCHVFLSFCQSDHVECRFIEHVVTKSASTYCIYYFSWPYNHPALPMPQLAPTWVREAL